MREDDTDLHPDTPYAITKLLGEHYAAFWADQHGLDVVTARLFNSYGPHEFPGRYRNVIPNFFQLALTGQPLTITGTGAETRDFTYVGDIVRGLMLLLFGDTPAGDVYNLGSGVETSIAALADQINAITGNTAGVVHTERRSWDHVSRRVADVSKARRRLGYEPAVGLAEGLEATYRWLSEVHA
jgi:nucleoside-diphosphate-sugar epimerase